jgi:hypothetical protein
MPPMVTKSVYAEFIDWNDSGLNNESVTGYRYFTAKQ